MVFDEYEVYTPQEVQAILKISDSTFRRLIRKGLLQVAKIGGQYRILGRNILAILSPSLPWKVRKMYKKVVKQPK